MTLTVPAFLPDIGVPRHRHVHSTTDNPIHGRRYAFTGLAIESSNPVGPAPGSRGETGTKLLIADESGEDVGQSSMVLYHYNSGHVAVKLIIRMDRCRN